MAVSAVQFLKPYSIRLSLLWVVVTVNQDYEHFLLFWLFATRSSYGCNYTVLYGMYFMIASLVAVAQQILAGLVVDAAGRRVNWVLVTSLVADMGLLAGLFFGTKTGGHYDWALIALQLARVTFTTISTYATTAIIKRHLAKVFPGETGTQTDVLNVTVTWGRLVAYFFLIVCCLFSFYGATKFDLSIDDLMMVIVAPEAVFNTLATIVALTIRSEFIDDANPELEAAGQVATSDPEELPMIGKGKGSSTGSSRGACSRGCSYAMEGFKEMWQSTIVVNALVLYFVLSVFDYVTYVPLSLAAAVDHGTKESHSGSMSASDGGLGTIGNYCDASLTNLLQGGYVLNIVEVVAMFFNGFFLLRFKPTQFYGYVLPILALLCNVVWLALFVEANWLAQTIVNSVMALAALLYFYSNNVGLAAVSSRFTGLYLLVGGIMTQVANLLPGYLAQAKVSAKLMMMMCSGMLLVVICYSWWFGAARRRELDAFQSKGDYREAEVVCEATSSRALTYGGMSNAFDQTGGKTATYFMRRTITSPAGSLNHDARARGRPFGLPE